MAVFDKFVKVDLRIVNLLMNLSYSGQMELEHVKHFPYLQDLTIFGDSEIPLSFASDVWSATNNLHSLTIHVKGGIKSTLTTFNSLKSLFSLSLHCQLTSGQLAELNIPDLVMLDLSTNKIDSLPCEFFEHKKLRLLALADNPMIIDPSEFISFEELRYLSVDGCGFSREALIDLSLNLPEIISISHDDGPMYFHEYYGPKANYPNPNYIDRSDLR